MEKRNVFGHFLTWFGLLIMAYSSTTVLAASGITYQGRLLKPDGAPVTSSNVQFRMQIRTPGGQDCLLYEETQTHDLSATEGVFAISLGDGSGSRQDSNPWSLFDALSNRKDFSFNPADCTGPNSYSPDPTDNRKFRVSFKENPASAWEDLPVQTINYIPMSIETYAVGGFPSKSLLRVEDAGTLGDVDPITTAQYDEIIDLVNGNSSLYSKPGELGGSALPSLGAGQAIVSDGSGGWQAATPLTSESDPTVEAFAKASLPTCGVGEILTSDGTSLSCVTDSGGWTATDATDTVKGIVVVPTGGGLEVSGGAIGLPDQALTPGSFTKVTVDQKGRVTSGASLVESDIPNLTSAGKVSGDAITSGTIGGTTSINSSGNIHLSGATSKVTSNYIDTRRLTLFDDQTPTPGEILLRAPATVSSNYTLTLPDSLGSANQVLGMNSAGTALENKSITAGAGVTINHTAGGIEITASGSGGTVTSVTGTTNEITVDNSDPSDPVIGLSDLAVSPAGSYGSATEVPVVTIDTKGRVTGVTETTITGVSPVGSTLSQNQVFIGDTNGDAEARYFSVADLRNASGTQQIQACTSSQTLIWSSITDTLSCTNISITTSQISNFPSLGTAAAKDFGTLAGNLVELNGSGEIPASLLPDTAYDSTYFKNGGNSFGQLAVIGTTDTQSLEIMTDNTTRISILTDGKVGVGTDLPFSELHVAGGGFFGDSTQFYSGADIAIQSATDPWLTLDSDNDGQVAIGQKGSTAQISTDTNALEFKTGHLWNFHPADHGTTRMIIRNDGNVGIGTTDPQYLLEAYGTNAAVIVHHDGLTRGGIASVGLEKLGLLTTASIDDIVFGYAGTSQSTFDSTFIEHMRIDNGTGNVGIGTDAPSTKLEVNGTVKATSFEGPMTSTSVSISDGSAASPSMTFSNDSNTGLYSSGADSIGVSAGGTQVWNITSSGIVSPTLGGASMSSSNGTAATPTFSFSGDEDTGWFRPAADTLAASTAGVERVRINSSGYLGIGTTAPWAPLTVHMDQNASTYATISNSDAGASARAEFILNNGTDYSSLFLNGTGAGRGFYLENTGSGGINISQKNSSGDISFLTGATPSAKMTIQNGGNVGIGTSSPTATLDVRSNSSTTAQIVATDDYPTLEVRNYGSTGGTSIKMINSRGTEGGQTPSAQWDWLGTISFMGSKTGSDAVDPVGIGNAGILAEAEQAFTNTSHPASMAFFTTPSGTTSSVRRMTITGSGNVGIGTSSPASPLEVSRNQASGTNLQVSNTNASGKSQLLLTNGTSYTWMYQNGTGDTSGGVGTDSPGGMYQQIINDSGDFIWTTKATTVERMRLTSDGNLGIGTTNPGAKLDVAGGIRSDTSFTLTGLGRLELGSGGTGLYFWSSDQLEFGSGGSAGGAKMTLTAAGNLGIGTGAPRGALDVRGAIRAMAGAPNSADGSTNGIAFENNGDTGIFLTDWAGTSGSGNLSFYSNNTKVMTIVGTRVGIGTPAPAHDLHVVGTAGLSTGTAWTNTSDVRLKDIHGDYEYGLDEILKLNTVRFSYKKNNPLGLPSDKEITGFIAQEVQEVIPEAVYEREDGYLELNVDPIHWATVNAVQDLYGICKMSEEQTQSLQARVDQHDREIASLKQENEELKRDVQMLRSYICEKDPNATFCR